MAKQLEMNWYEEKQERRRERYEELAAKHEQQSAARYQAAKQIGDTIPFGQPILVGHHSERGHRADLKRIDNNMRKSCEHSDTAKYYENKAKSVGKGGISSDDPAAIEKLKAKLEQLQANQEYMKRINKIHRAYKKNPKSIDNHELTDKEREVITNYEPEYSWIPSPFTPYQLQNNNANIRRIKGRIAELERASEREHQEIENEHGLVIVQNVAENRVQVLFEGKPRQEIRSRIKKYHGFRWSRYHKAWQRHLNNAGISHAKLFLEWLEKEYPAGNYYS